MAQISNIEKEDLRVIIKGELKKIWDKHYATNHPEHFSCDMYKLRWGKERFVLNIFSHFKRLFSFKSSFSSRAESDDLGDLISFLSRISPTTVIKLNGSRIIVGE